jgi:hypothetical protein
LSEAEEAGEGRWVARVWRKMRKHYKFGLHVAEKTSRREKEKKAKKMVWEEG